MRRLLLALRLRPLSLLTGLAMLGGGLYFLLLKSPTPPQAIDAAVTSGVGMLGDLPWYAAVIYGLGRLIWVLVTADDVQTTSL